MTCDGVKQRLLDLDRDVVVLMLVVNDNELNAVLRKLQSLEGPDGAVFKCFNATLKQGYWVGSYGLFPCVLLQTDMGPGGMQDAASVALRFWKPKVVINVGVAWGVDAEKQKMGDVLIASRVVELGNNTKASDGALKTRSEIPACGTMLTRCARFVKDTWARDSALKWNKRWYPESRRQDGEEQFVVHLGKIVSGGILLNDRNLKAQIVANPDYSDVQGGEMELYGLYRAANAQDVLDWIMIKGICDWGCFKQDGWQPLAAATAADFVHHMLAGPSLQDLLCNAIR